MDYLRKTVDSNDLEPLFNLPEALRNRKVEVIILPVDEKKENASSVSLAGKLSKYANPSLISLENGAWSNALRQKHDHS